MTIGEAIRYHRLRMNLTQSQLGDQIGVSAAAVSKWETGVGLPDVSVIVPLARVLGTTTDELLRFGERRGAWEAQWEQTLRNWGAEPSAMLEVSIEALKEFPFDRIFLYRAAVDEQRLSESEPDPRKAQEYLGRAASHAQLLVELEPENRDYRRLLHSLRNAFFQE